MVGPVAGNRSRKRRENKRLCDYQPTHPAGNEVKLRLDSLSESRNLRQDMRDIACFEFHGSAGHIEVVHGTTASLPQLEVA
jgi:hypothetical protein